MAQHRILDIKMAFRVNIARGAGGPEVSGRRLCQAGGRSGVRLEEDEPLHRPRYAIDLVLLACIKTGFGVIKNIDAAQFAANTYILILVAWLVKWEYAQV